VDDDNGGRTAFLERRVAPALTALQPSPTATAAASVDLPIGLAQLATRTMPVDTPAEPVAPTVDHVRPSGSETQGKTAEPSDGLASNRCAYGFSRRRSITR
jgi:hypothetical protein